jgi:hypothetical protein
MVRFLSVEISTKNDTQHQGEEATIKNWKNWKECGLFVWFYTKEIRESLGEDFP